MAEREGVNEALKAANQMEWVRRMNLIKSRVEEILYHDYVYGERNMERKRLLAYEEAQTLIYKSANPI